MCEWERGGKCTGDWHRGREKCPPAWILHDICFDFNSHMCLFVWKCSPPIASTGILWEKTFPPQQPSCAPGRRALQHRDDSCGTRLQNGLDCVSVDSACPPVETINSVCQIFSLLRWAHSAAEWCINIQSDQSRALRGRVQCGGVYMSMCGWVKGQAAGA